MHLLKSISQESSNDFSWQEALGLYYYFSYSFVLRENLAKLLEIELTKGWCLLGQGQWSVRVPMSHDSSW